MPVLWVSDLDLDSLQPVPEAILLALGAIGQPTARGHLAQTLVKSKVAPQAAAWIGNPAGMTPVLARLKEAGWVEEPSRGYWTLAPRALEPVCRRAHRKGVLRALAAAGQGTFESGRVLLDAVGRDLAALRLTFLEGKPVEWLPASERVAQAHRAALGFRDPLALLCGRPFDPAWFGGLSPEAQSYGAWALLHDALRFGAEDPAFLSWLAERAQRGAGPLGPVTEWLLLEGRLDEARVRLDKLRPEQRALTPLALLGAALALARGDAAAASAGFEGVLEHLARGPRRKAVHLPGIMDLFCFLAFIGRGDDEGLRLATERLEVLGRRQEGDPLRELLAPFQRLLLHRAGLPPKPALPGRERPRGLARFVDLLCEALCGARLDPADAEGLREALAEGPFGLFRVELEELIRRAGGALPTRRLPFLDLVGHPEGWEKALEDLKGLGRPASKGRPGRLAWWVWRSDEARGPYALEAREQRQDARGQWTRGKAIGLKRLKDEARTFDFLLPQDHAVIACIREGWKGCELNVEAALQALVGHPVVFWSEGDVDQAARVEVVAGQPELRVERRDDVLELRLEPPLSDQDVMVVPDGLFRVRVIAITGAHRRLESILGRGLGVPLAAQDQVLKALRAVAPMVTVQSDVKVREDAARRAGMEKVAGNPAMQLLLMPFHQGLKAQLRVEPLPGGGFHAPGQGGANLLVDEGGATRLVTRDLEAERAAADALLAALPSLPADEGRAEWMLDDPEACMALLLDLEGAPGLAQVRWPEGGRLAPPRTLGLESVSLRVRAGGGWFEAEGEVKLDEGQVANLQELLAASESAGTRFVRLADGKVYALAESFRRRLDDLRALGEVRGSAVRLPALGALALEGLEGETGSFQADAAWRARLGDLQAALAWEPDLPAGWETPLRAYQLDGYRWMQRLAKAGLGACLADDMGLGKTVQTLALLSARSAEGPALVVAPTSVCANWEAEAARFTPGLRLIRFGEGDRDAAVRDAGPRDVVICTYGLLAMEAERLQSRAWATVVLDEGQNIKNAATKRSQAVMELEAGFRLVLSGTPVENRLAELWNLLQFLNPGLLGGPEHFRKRFQEPIERDQDPEALARLRRVVAPFLLRRTKGEVASELPPRTDIVLELEPSPEERAFLEALRRASLDALQDGPGQSMQVLASLMRLRRACCAASLVQPDLDLPSAKREAFLDLVDELRENGHRALVFSQFTDHLGLLAEALKARGIPFQHLDGSTPARARTKAVKAFQAGEGDLFLISLKAGGTGLNLTAADYVIHMDPWWNPAAEDQASDRAHRIGQLRPVTVYRLVLKGTVEQRILALHAQKRQLAEDILEGAAAAARLDAAALLALLREE